MSAVSSIADISSRVQLLSERSEKNKILNRTPAAYEKISLIALGGISSFSGSTILLSTCYGFTATVTGIPISLTLIVVGGLLFWVSTKIYDYNDQAELKKFREEAGKIYDDIQFALENNIFESEKELEQIGTDLIGSLVDTHGWENIFYYGIPLPDDFEKIYKLQLKFVDLNTWIHFHQKAETAYFAAQKKYGDNMFKYPILDHKLWNLDLKNKLNEKWKKEIRQCKVKYEREGGNYIKKVFKKYDIQTLADLGIISTEEKEQFSRFNNRYMENKKQFAQDNNHVYPLYKKNIGPFKYKRDREIWKANKQYRLNPAHQQLEEIKQLLLEEVHEVIKEREMTIQPIRKQLKDFEDGVLNSGAKALEDLSPLVQQNLTRERENAQKEIQNVVEKFNGPIAEIRKRYLELKKNLVLQLSNVETLKQKQLQHIKQEFKAKKEKIKPQYSDFLHGPYENYRNRNQAIKEEFSNYF